MEQSKSGVSINDMEKALLEIGYDQDKLEKQILSLGYHRGNSARKEKYEIIERRLYEVDDYFPQITPKVFKDNIIPHAITHITYEVSLEGIDYTVWG